MLRGLARMVEKLSSPDPKVRECIQALKKWVDPLRDAMRRSGAPEETVRKAEELVKDHDEKVNSLLKYYDRKHFGAVVDGLETWADQMLGQTVSQHRKVTTAGDDVPSLVTEAQPPHPGVPLRAIAEILQNSDAERTDAMLSRWNKCRRKKPRPVGRNPSDRREWLYEPTAVVAWIKNEEGDLTVPEDALIKRLTRLAVEPLPGN